MAKPFLKWAGGKYRLLPHLLPHLSVGSVLAESFAGAASVSLNIDKEQYYLNDINPDLIACFEALKDHGKDFISYSKSYFTERRNVESVYYDLRAEFNQTASKVKRAALFIYLNRHGYNGLCRYSKTGGYNVPYGRYKSPYFPLSEMESFVNKSARFILSSLPHNEFLALIMSKKFGSDLSVYCDPPYLPLSDTGFTEYSGRAFTDKDQMELARLANNLSSLGSTVVVSNHDTEQARKLYSRASINSVNVARTISCNTGNRKSVKEVIAVFCPSQINTFKITA